MGVLQEGYLPEKYIHLYFNIYIHVYNMWGDRGDNSSLLNVPGSMASRQCLECVNLPGVIKNPMSLA